MVERATDPTHTGNDEALVAVLVYSYPLFGITASELLGKPRENARAWRKSHSGIEIISHRANGPADEHLRILYRERRKEILNGVGNLLVAWANYAPENFTSQNLEHSLYDVSASLAHARARARI